MKLGSLFCKKPDSGKNGEKFISNKCKHIVIYGESTTYWSTFLPLLEELGRRNQVVTYLTSSENDPCFSHSLPSSVSCKYIGTGNRAFMKLNLMQADVMVLTTPGVDVLQIRRSRGVGKYIHVLHSIVDLHKYKLFSFDYYDAVICNGNYQVKSFRALETVRGTKPKELPVAGCLYLDGLTNRLRVATPPPPDPDCILVAPTWGGLGMLSRYGDAVPRILAEAGFRVIIRPHPQSFISEAEFLAQIEKGLANHKNIVWDKNRDGFDSLAKASLLISDFSGVMFDFAFLFSRPVITLYDREREMEGYEAYDIPHPNWNIEIIKDMGAIIRGEDIERLPGIVRNLLKQENWKERILAIRDANVANFGSAAGPVTDAILDIAARARL